MVNSNFSLQNCVLFWRKSTISVLEGGGGGGDNAYLMSLQVPLPDPAGADPKGWGILLAGTS